MDVAVAFGQVLRSLRRNAGLTQEQLGFEADLERNFISMLELGQRQPSLMTVFRLAKVLKISPAQLIEQVTSKMKDDPEP